MARLSRTLSVISAAALISVLGITTPAGALSVGKGELRGNELRVEGNDAIPNAPITADGITIGSANGNGSFDLRFSPFSSPTCITQVSDGAETVAVELDRCSPSAPPSNQAPTANAGASQVVADSDGDGFELVVLDGTGSSDVDGLIVDFVWRQGTTVIASGPTGSVVLAVGSHTVALTVTDDDGAAATDEVSIVVNPSPPPPTNQSPIAVAGPDQMLIDSDGNGVETVILDGSASTDPDGTIVSYQWTEAGSPLGGFSAPGRSLVAANAVVGGDYDFLFESNQPDPPGIVPNGFGGSAASAGDVNGDGFADVIIGSEVWDAGSEFAEGAALLFLGGPNGPTGSNPSNAHAIIEMNQAGATVNDVSSAGDVNGDGFADVIVGSHFYDSVLPGTQLAVDGAAFVFHGGPNGVTATGPAQADGAIFANQLTSGMGEYVDSAGDVNGDGFSDIVVSVPRQGTLFPPAVPINDRSGNYGAILVFHGGPDGITGSGFSDADSIILPYQDTGQPLPPVDAQVGRGLGAGDVNNDGFDDLVVGGTELTLYLGGPSGLVAQDVFDANDRIFANPPLQVSSSIGGAGIGFVVEAAGDLNGDGFADVVASIPGRQLDPGTVPTGQGAVYVFLGSAAGLGVSSVDQAHATILGTVGNEALGASISGAGDVDADGFDDLLVGAHQYSGSEPFEGVGYVFRGGPQGITATTTASADSRLEARQPDAIRDTNRYGFDVSNAGDVDNDGFADVIVGKGFYDNGQENEGAAFLYNGQAFPVSPNLPPVPIAGADQDVVDVDADGLITFSVDGSASFDPDGSVVSHEWYTTTVSPQGSNRVLLGSGPTATFELPLVSPNAAFGHIVTLVVTDNQGVERGDELVIFPQLAPETFEFAEWATLDGWATVGSVQLGNAAVSFPDPPHVRMTGSASLSRTFTPAPGTTGLDLSFWGRADGFAAGDVLSVQASVDGGPFTDYFSLTGAELADGEFTFYGGSALPISMSWWPATASTVTLRFETSASATADFWLATLRVESIQAPTTGVVNAPPTANAGPDQTLTDADGNGSESVMLDASASTDADGSIIAYQWRLGATVVGSAASLVETLAPGSYTFTLVVTDDQGATDVDTVVVTVTSPPPDPSTLVVDLTIGTHTILLTVTDDEGATSSDTVEVVVAPLPSNSPPTANAGPDRTIVDADNSGSELVPLDGTASSDAEGPLASVVWQVDGSQIATGAQPLVSLTVGTHLITLTVTDSDGATASDDVVITVEAAPPPGAGDQVFISSSSGGSVAGVSFADEDILVFDTSAQSWSLYIDGSDVGLGGAGARDVDAFHINPDGSILMSIVSASSLPDVGAVDDSDIVRLIPTSTGSQTAGTFELYFDGSDVGLTSNGEDVDAVSLTANGDILISTSGGASVPGLSGIADEDLIRFTPSALGSDTSGVWSRFFDGSDVGLANSSSEDTGGAWFDEVGDLYLTTRGTFALANVTGTGADVFGCTPLSSGEATSCGTNNVFFDGSAFGVGGEALDGLHIIR